MIQHWFGNSQEMCLDTLKRASQLLRHTGGMGGCLKGRLTMPPVYMGTYGWFERNTRISNINNVAYNRSLDFNGMMPALRSDVINTPSRKPTTNIHKRIIFTIIMRRKLCVTPTPGSAGTGALFDEIAPASVMHEA